MSFGKLTVGVQSWHARLFQQAYIADRASWRLLTEAEIVGMHNRAHDTFATDQQEVDRLFAAYMTAANDPTSAADDRAMFLQAFKQAKQNLEDLKDPWFKQEALRIHEQNAQQLRERFDAGQVSLCPYFHMVWWAVLWYVILIPFGRQLARAASSAAKMTGARGAQIGRMIAAAANFVITPVVRFSSFLGDKCNAFYTDHKDPIDRGTRLTMKAATAIWVAMCLAAVVFGVVKLGGEIMTSYSESQVRNARIEKDHAEYEAFNSAQMARQKREEAKANLEWKKGEPQREALRLEQAKLWNAQQLEKAQAQEELQRVTDEQNRLYREEHPEVTQKEADDVLWRASEAEMTARMTKIWKGIEDAKEIQSWVLLFCKLVAGIYFIVILFRDIFPFIGRVSSQLSKTRFVIRTFEILSYISGRIYAFGVAIQETVNLVGSFLRASYRGICPYIQFEKPDQDN